MPSPIPAVTFSSAPALEVRLLGGGKRITFEQADEEVAELGAGWRLETMHELIALFDSKHKNQHGAYSQDESLKPSLYWASDVSTWSSEARVVVSFGDGLVGYDGRGDTALARAVRVSGQ